MSVFMFVVWDWMLVVTDRETYCVPAARRTVMTSTLKPETSDLAQHMHLSLVFTQHVNHSMSQIHKQSTQPQRTPPEAAWHTVEATSTLLPVSLSL